MLPTVLQERVSHALDEVGLHVERKLSLQSRRELYKLLMTNSAYGWLAFITARRVLPIFSKTFPPEFFEALSDEEIDLIEGSPYNLLKVTEELLLRRVDVETVNSVIAAGYDIQWYYVKDNVPNNAVWAANAAVRALTESSGVEPLQHVSLYHKRDVNGAWISGENWDDEELANSGGDTVSAAVVAFASDLDYSDPAKAKCNPTKTQEFWEWWLTEAIPQAWELAEKSIST